MIQFLMRTNREFSKGHVTRRIGTYSYRVTSVKMCHDGGSPVVNNPDDTVYSPLLFDCRPRIHAIVADKGRRTTAVLVDLLCERLDNELVVGDAVDVPGRLY